MKAVFATFLLCFLSVSHCARMVCEQLVHPLGTLEAAHFQGSWAFVAGSLKHAESMEALRLRDSITGYFSNPNSSQPHAVSYTQVNRFGDRCEHLHYNTTMAGSSFTFDVGGRFELHGVFLRTSCPDCAVMQWVVKSRRRVSVDMYLLSRRREVTRREMDEFRDQLRCYGLPAPVVMDPTKELCGEAPESQPTAAAPTEGGL